MSCWLASLCLPASEHEHAEKTWVEQDEVGGEFLSRERERFLFRTHRRKYTTILLRTGHGCSCVDRSKERRSMRASMTDKDDNRYRSTSSGCLPANSSAYVSVTTRVTICVERLEMEGTNKGRQQDRYWQQARCFHWLLTSDTHERELDRGKI